MDNKKSEPYRILAENADQILGWIRKRGGIALWKSIDLSDPGASWTTPARQEDGAPPLKPHWKADAPYRFITDPAEVLVDIPKEFKRFRVAIRQHGLSLKCTDASTRRIRTTCEKAKEQYGESWFAFSYSDQTAGIFVPEKTLPLIEWERENAGSSHE